MTKYECSQCRLNTPPCVVDIPGSKMENKKLCIVDGRYDADFNEVGGE